MHVQARAYFHKVVKPGATSVIQAKAREVYLDPATSVGPPFPKDCTSLMQGTRHDMLLWSGAMSAAQLPCMVVYVQAVHSLAAAGNSCN